MEAEGSQVSIVIIAITRDSDYLNSIENQLRMRNRPILIKDWDKSELVKIPEIGFEKLGTMLPGMLRDRLCDESLNTAAIMQCICLELALISGHEYANEIKSDYLRITDKQLNDVFYQASLRCDMSSIYASLIRLSRRIDSITTNVMMRFQPQRGILDDTRMTIHEAVIQSLVSKPGAKMSLDELFQQYKKIIIQPPGEATLKLEDVLYDLRFGSDRIWKIEAEVGGEGINNAMEISLFSWNPKTKLASIEDPYFAFFVRFSRYLVGLI
ncbi:MAG: hypothetical protein BroJett018_00010 [Chloroflexota bacterium]|nr:hypothetical protein [Chloroflexota bacterium]NOG63347.1 hypothetical protein [Chloroflexota bacterium]GIK62207.1 MAG: hypothetical protein BroJett018_00010 [Chloroflexota bacterium]